MSIVDQFGRPHTVSDVRHCLTITANLLIKQGAVLNEMQIIGIISSLRGRDSFISAATSSGKATVFKGTLVMFDLLYNGHGRTRVDKLQAKFVVIVCSPLIGLMEEMVTTFNASPAARELTLRAVHTSGVLADSKDMTDICNGRYDLVFTSSESTPTARIPCGRICRGSMLS